MNYEKRARFIKITALAITLVFGVYLILKVAIPLFNNKDKTGINKEISNKKTLQSKVKILDEQSDNAADTAKYMTISQAGNIQIVVNYLNPVMGNKDTLMFEIALGTHSVDLTKYKDIRKYVELRTDTGVVINDGFEWILENSESHHISGILKIKNSFKDNPIIGPNTKAFKLVFKNIGGVNERENVYEIDRLK